MSEWTLDQIAAAINAIGEFSILYREKKNRIGGPEPFYVSQDVEISDGHICCGSYGNGFTPEEAIRDHWSIISNLKPDQHLVVGRERKRVKWNGFMWEDFKP
jgi:hypothetical protein